MDKQLQEKLKKQLEGEKKRLTKDLNFFAKKDPKLKWNWLTRFPFFGMSRSHKDEIAEQVEEYENLLPVEHSLEKRLEDVEKALAKVKKDNYGQCEKCQKEIEIKRLAVVPEARLCVKCAKENPNP